jgi:endonuclease YncB( thermonuclease family)
MKADGTFEIIRIAKLEKWKDSGKIIVSKNGLDTWAPGFENAAAVEEAEAAARANKKGFFGLF